MYVRVVEQRADLTQQAFRIALAPTRAQEEFLSSCAGASRFWFNQA
jgi:Helix-turn-helix domain